MKQENTVKSVNDLRVLTVEERENLYNDGKGLGYDRFNGTLLDGLIAYWPLDKESEPNPDYVV